MHSAEQSGSRRGSAAWLALLVSLLLGSGPAAAFPQLRTASAGQPTASKAAIAPRTVKRDAADRADRFDPLDGPPQAIFVETQTLALRPVRDGVAVEGTPSGLARPPAYRARAPPAA